MSIYREELLLRSKDVDLHRNLRLSRLFELLQEASIRHTEQLGMGREKTLDRGLLWVLLMQRAEILRMPEYDEEIFLKTWPGDTMHLLFPRYYMVGTAKGEILIRASALWSLVDAKSRKVIFPEKYGIRIPGESGDEKIALPGSIPKPEAEAEQIFTVPYSFVDLNGHMNNTRYFDLAEDCIGAAAAGCVLRKIETEYTNEAPFGEKLLLRWQKREDGFLLSGEGEKPVFRMRLAYDP
jgi:acyl-ACP thioesterase